MWDFLTGRNIDIPKQSELNKAAHYEKAGQTIGYFRIYGGNCGCAFDRGLCLHE
jgi:hypothetical protein